MPSNNLVVSSRPAGCTCAWDGVGDPDLISSGDQNGLLSVTSYGSIPHDTPLCDACRAARQDAAADSDLSVIIDNQQLMPGPLEGKIRTYRSRWYILILFSLLALMQGGLCNVWTVISESANAVFQWSDKEISLMQGWLNIMYLITMVPSAWLMDTKGDSCVKLLCY